MTAGQNGVISGMRISTQMVMELNRVKHGGKENMGRGGIALGARATMVQGGFTSTEGAAAVSTGIRMQERTHGMRDTHIMGLCIALIIQCSLGKSRDLLGCRDVRIGIMSLLHSFVWFNVKFYICLVVRR